MAFEKRKAYIEFLGKKTVQIVTPYKTTMFDLDKSLTFDLISFKTDPSIFKEISGFYAIFQFDEDQKEFYCTVNMRVSEREIQEIGVCDPHKYNKQIFQGTVWVK